MIKKRDGRCERFHSQKIVNAICSAMENTPKGIDVDLANRIAEEISRSNNLEKRDSYMTVEDIQNLVENKLMASRRKDVAKEYITYRAERTRIRNLNKELYRETKNILDCVNITNDNANIDQYSFSGRENRVGSELHKRYALDNLISKDVRQAFEDGYIYIHDLDKYAIGMHNCLFADVDKLLSEGFSTRNGDVRPANSIATAFQLLAVIFQIQSQVQYGGVASSHIDYDLAPYVKKSFAKHLKNGFLYVESFYDIEWQDTNGASMNEMLNEVRLKGIECPASLIIKKNSPKVWNYAYNMLQLEGKQGAQSLYHNLNTLESRAGAQVPFTSINFGRDTSREGQLVSEWLLKASLDGIGKHKKTSIFPISIFQHKKGVNDVEGTPNYYLKQLAIKSMCKRIYPNWINCDYSQHLEDPDDIDTIKASMGCRTQIGGDKHGLGYRQVGRGNIAPTTIILPKLGIEYGICDNKRQEADINGFFDALDKTIDITVKSLVDRFRYVSGQSPKAAPFMYQNGTIAKAELCKDNVREALKHGTLAVGFIGVAEMCQALFGKTHSQDKKVHEFALKVVEYIHHRCQAESEKYNLNFSCYATPAENLCWTAMSKLKNEYGKIPKVTDRDYLTNSTHVPVWEEVSISEKLEAESPFTKYTTGGCITYIECDTHLSDNPKGVEELINYAMDLDIPYLAINFPIDTCLKCGFQGDIESSCPKCKGSDIERLARVTGYLTTDKANFNKGKQSEVDDRVKHGLYVDFGQDEGGNE